MPRGKESSKSESVAVVLPTLNEEGNIFQLCMDIWKCLQNSLEVSIIVVDDKSQDQTVPEAIRAKRSGAPVEVFENIRPMGLGASIGRGIAETNTDLVAVMDADFTHSVEDLREMLELINRYEFVSGARFGGVARAPERNRYSSSRVYQMMLKPVVGLKLDDILGGFWVARRQALATVPSRDIFRGYGDYYFRLLSHLDRNGVLIKEFAASYHERKSGKSKSKPLKMIILYLSRAVWWRIRLCI